VFEHPLNVKEKKNVMLPWAKLFSCRRHKAQDGWSAGPRVGTRRDAVDHDERCIYASLCTKFGITAGRLTHTMLCLSSCG
jgi:hypothetical protein